MARAFADEGLRACLPRGAAERDNWPKPTGAPRRTRSVCRPAARKRRGTLEEQPKGEVRSDACGAQASGQYFQGGYVTESGDITKAATRSFRRAVDSASS